MTQTTQDKRGVWLENYDGEYGTDYPGGDKPAPGGFSYQWSEDFEGGTLGNSISSAGFSDTNGVFDNTHTFSGTKAARHDMTQGSDNALAYGFARTDMPTMHEGDEVWIQGMFYYPAGWDFGNAGDSNLGGSAQRSKFFRWRVYNNADVSLGYNDIYLWKDVSEPNQSRWQFIFENQGTGTWAFNYSSDEAAGRGPAPITGIPLGEWVKVELYIKFHSDPAQARVRMWVNNVLSFQISDMKTLNSSTDYTAEFRYCTYYNGGAPANQSMWTDRWRMCSSVTDTPTNTDAGGNFFIGDGA